MKKFIVIIPLLIITFFIGFYAKDIFLPSKKDTEAVKPLEPVKPKQTKDEKIKFEEIKKRKEKNMDEVNKYLEQITPIIQDITDTYNRIVLVNERMVEEIYYLDSPEYQQDVLSIATYLESLALQIKKIDPGTNNSVKHAHDYMVNAAEYLGPFAVLFKSYMLSGRTQSDLQTMLRNKDEVTGNVQQAEKVIDEYVRELTLLQ
ncbi:hypothetical protein QNH48_28370 [Neobacillus sp. YX16]|uniref:hypothetical protein n=1 Tax=Neobacillus sp. YX16 TaxID=3047874 RepID=UPI0024C2F4FB|nr:hypothetical protein [Neobacillus sp. YX16]WHZ02789.1 hypothetical protein QNH48_28370 [Neobacillus sp. YX16]